MEELEAIGFILPADAGDRYIPGVGRGIWKIVFEREERKALAKPLTGSKEERTTNRVLLKQLTDRGVTPVVAHGLVENSSFGEKLIREKIDLLDWYLEERPDTAPKQRGGWLTKAIKDNYLPPSDYLSREDRQRIKQETAAKKKAGEQLRQAKEEERRQVDQAAAEKWEEEIRQVEGYLTSLSEGERKTCIDVAIAGKDPMKLARKYRANAEPGSMAEAAYYQLLIAHVLPLLETASVA